MSHTMLRSILGISLLAISVSVSGCGGKEAVVVPTNVLTASEAGDNKPPFPSGSPGNMNKTGSSGAPNGPPSGGGGGPPRK